MTRPTTHSIPAVSVLRIVAAFVLLQVVPTTGASAQYTVFSGGGSYRAPLSTDIVPFTGNSGCVIPSTYLATHQTVAWQCSSYNPLVEGGGIFNANGYGEAGVNGVLRARSELTVSEFVLPSDAEIYSVTNSYNAVRLNVTGEGTPDELTVWYRVSGTLGLYSGTIGNALQGPGSNPYGFFGWSQDPTELYPANGGYLYFNLIDGISAVGNVGYNGGANICCYGVSDQVVGYFSMFVAMPHIQVADGAAVWNMTLQGGGTIHNIQPFQLTIDDFRLVYDWSHSAVPIGVQAFDASGNDVTGLYRYAWSDGTSLAGGGPDTTVPEPGAMILLATGLVGLGMSRQYSRWSRRP